MKKFLIAMAPVLYVFLTDCGGGSSSNSAANSKAMQAAMSQAVNASMAALQDSIKQCINNQLLPLVSQYQQQAASSAPPVNINVPAQPAVPGTFGTTGTAPLVPGQTVTINPVTGAVSSTAIDPTTGQPGQVVYLGANGQPTTTAPTPATTDPSLVTSQILNLASNASTPSPTVAQPNCTIGQPNCAKLNAQAAAAAGTAKGQQMCSEIISAVTALSASKWSDGTAFFSKPGAMPYLMSQLGPFINQLTGGLSTTQQSYMTGLAQQGLQSAQATGLISPSLFLRHPNTALLLCRRPNCRFWALRRVASIPSLRPPRSRLPLRE